MRRIFLAALLSGTALSAAIIAPPAQAIGDIAFRQSIISAARSAESIAAFYEARAFAPFWTEDGPEGRARLEALASALDRADDHGLPAARFNSAALLAVLSTGESERDRGRIEAEISQLLLDYAKALDTGLLTPSRIDSTIVRAVPYANELTYLTGFAGQPSTAFFDTLAPQSREYQDLRRELFALRAEIATGADQFPKIPAGLAIGSEGAGVVALRDRLITLGYLTPTVTARFDEAVEAALLRFQADHRLTEDGVAGAETVELLNLSTRDKLTRVLVAMERERWMPATRGDIHIEVNLPDFHTRVIEEGRTTFLTKSIIGRQDHDDQTPEFSDEMEHMVINPSWNVPWSIATESYLPKLRANPNAVSHLRLVDSRGRTVSRNQNFARFNSSSFPYRFVQAPGPRNALGQVKFMFPNAYAIYLHDTPERHLFGRAVRTNSAGCVRLHRPRELAEFLLSRQMDDPSSYYDRVRRSGHETTVKLDTNIPVHIIYRTAFANELGVIEYRADVYGRDAKIARALAAEGVSAEKPGV